MLLASCYGNRDKLRPDGPLGSSAEVTFFTRVGFQIMGMATSLPVPFRAYGQTINLTTNFFQPNGLTQIFLGIGAARSSAVMPKVSPMVWWLSRRRGLDSRKPGLYPLPNKRSLK